MVWALEDIEDIEERNLRLGHIAVIVKHFDSAEEFFLQSSQPVCALHVSFLAYTAKHSVMIKHLFLFYSYGWSGSSNILKKGAEEAR